MPRSQAQIAHLQQQAETIRKHELDAVIADVKSKIAQYGLTARDLGLAGATLRGAKKTMTSATRFVGRQSR